MAKETAGKGEKEVTEEKADSVFRYGLSDKEAERRLKEYGQNKIAMKSPFTIAQVLGMFLDQFLIPTLLLLFSLVFLLTIDFTVALLALGMVLLTVAGETFRDLQVRKTVRELQERYIQHVIVVRGGARKLIPATEVVPGDIVILLPGTRVPADGVIIRGSCKVDESVFGRGIADRKRKERLEEKKLPSFRAKGEEEKEEREVEYYRIFAGTFLVEGEAIMSVERTGKDTMLANTVQRETRKKYMAIEKMEEVTDRLTGITLLIAFVIFVVLMYNQVHFIAALAIAAAAAVAGIPQSVLLTARVAFSQSLKRIEGLAIRSEDLPERLGKVSVICTERMKALSMGEPTVRRLWIDRNDAEVSGDGWSRAGKFKDIKDYKTLDLLSESLVISTSAVPIYKEGGEFYFENSEEGAFVTMAMKNNMPTETIRNENYCLSMKTNPETGVVTSVHTTPERQNTTYLRGPARKVAELCDFVYSEGKKEKIDRILKEEIEHKMIEMAAEGYAPHAIAYSTGEKGKRFILLALMGIYDPPKPEIKAMIEETNAAGIRVVLLTEEKASAAVDFARQLGILTSSTKAIICDQLRFMKDAERRETIRKTVVFALATSDDKKMVVSELREMGERVLFIDSGSADIAALRAANISMSLESSAEASKYNADAILLDDNFYWVPKAIEESKALGNTVIRSFYSLFISDFTILFVVLLSAILATRTQSVVQILFVNIIADSLISLGIAMDRQKGSALRAAMKFPSRGDFAFSILLAVFSAVAIFAAADYFHDAYFTSVATAGLVVCAIANTMNFSSDGSLFKSGLTPRMALAMIVALAFILLVTYTPANTVFGMLPLQTQHWGMVLIPAVSVIFIMEMRKALSQPRQPALAKTETA